MAVEFGDQGFDRRIKQRFRIDTNIRAYVEHRFVRYPGQIIDISTGGFRMSTPLIPVINSTAKERPNLDFGEIEYKGKCLGGFGQIAHFKHTKSGLEIGFSWDSSRAIEIQIEVNDLIKHLIRQRQAGSVSCVEKTVTLTGCISNALSGDLLSAIDNLDAKMILVGENTSITDSGVDLLSDLINRGFDIKYNQPEIQFIISRVTKASAISAKKMGSCC